MAFLNSDIPDIGDLVTDVQVEEPAEVVRITFSSGKSVIVHLSDVEQTKANLEWATQRRNSLRNRSKLKFIQGPR